MPYFTNGIEANNFEGLNIIAFSGTASPTNKNAYRIYAEDGKDFTTDDKKNVMLKNVQ